MGLLVLVEAVSVYLLWTISPVGKTDEAVFAIFLAITLVSLAMISNVYRSYMNGGQLNRAFLLTCCGLMVILVTISLALQ